MPGDPPCPAGVVFNGRHAEAAQRPALAQQAGREHAPVAGLAASLRAKPLQRIVIRQDDGSIQVVPVARIDYIEAAETKAIGRALAALGYGTQFCSDFDFSSNARPGKAQVVDAPVSCLQG